MNPNFTNLRLYLGDVYKALDRAYVEAKRLEMDQGFTRAVQKAGIPVDYLIEHIDTIEGNTD